MFRTIFSNLDVGSDFSEQINQVVTRLNFLDVDVMFLLKIMGEKELG